MRTWPKTRPSTDASIQAANASREAAARLLALNASGDASGNLFLSHGLAGASGDEVRHGRVGADRGAIEDGLVLSYRHLAGQTEILGYRLARVPPLGYKHGDKDHVLRLDVLDDLPDPRLLIQKPDLDQVVDPALPDAPGVQVDHTARVLVEIGAVPQQYEGRAPRGLLAAHQVAHTLEDDV